MGRVLAKQSGLSLPDPPTVDAIALVAYVASNVLHEAVGHGGACLALGGKPLCSRQYISNAVNKRWVRFAASPQRARS
jgi:hypothetical protein